MAGTLLAPIWPLSTGQWPLGTWLVTRQATWGCYSLLVWPRHAVTMPHWQPQCCQSCVYFLPRSPVWGPSVPISAGLRAGLVSAYITARALPGSVHLGSPSPAGSSGAGFNTRKCCRNAVALAIWNCGMQSSSIGQIKSRNACSTVCRALESRLRASPSKEDAHARLGFVLVSPLRIH